MVFSCEKIGMNGPDFQMLLPLLTPRMKRTKLQMSGCQCVAKKYATLCYIMVHYATLVFTFEDDHLLHGEMSILPVPRKHELRLFGGVDHNDLRAVRRITIVVGPFFNGSCCWIKIFIITLIWKGEFQPWGYQSSLDGGKSRCVFFLDENWGYAL